MARTRNSSIEPERRIRNFSHPPPTAPRVALTRTRTKSPSPGPNAAATGRTSFRRDQPTPVQSQGVATTKASPPQQQQTTKVVKKRSLRPRGRRAGSVESDGRRSSAGSENGGVLIGETSRRALALVPEDDEISTYSSPKYQSAQVVQQPRGHSPVPSIHSSPSSSSSRSASLPRLSALGIDDPGAQQELEDMDKELMLETFIDLDSYAQKVLDLLILRPPNGDLLRDLRIPSSKISKRLRLYQQNFTASKSAYGTSRYLAISIVEQALGTKILNPLLCKANLAALANFAHTAAESSEETFQELKEIERSFPAQFGDVIHGGNFQAALELRTQTLILGLAKGQELSNFNPDEFLKHFFMVRVGSGRLGKRKSDKENYQFKAWTEMQRVEDWEMHVRKRITDIRGTFELHDDVENVVNFEELKRLFPWNRFVGTMAAYIHARLVEVEDQRRGASIHDLVETAENAVGLTEAAEPSSPERPAEGGGVVLGQSEIPDSVQGSEADADQPPPDAKSVVYPYLPAIPEAVDATLQEADDTESVPIAPSKWNKRVEQQERDLQPIISTTAQMKELKRRKTEPFLHKKVELGTPRTATSLDSKDSIAINKNQIKLLKSLKSGTGPQKQVELEEKEVEEPEANQNPPSSSARDFYKKLERNKNKENDKALALILPQPASPPRAAKRKRFLDHQEGATKVSQIDDETMRDASPSKRRQLEKGKGRAVPVEDVQARISSNGREKGPIAQGKGRATPPVQYEENGPSLGNDDEGEAPESSSREPRPIAKVKSRIAPPEADDEDVEDEDVYERDPRPENEERRKKSRRNLSNTSTATTSTIPTRRSSARPSTVAVRQRQIVRRRDSRAETPIDVDRGVYEEEEEEDEDSGEDGKPGSVLARVGELARLNHVRKIGPPRQMNRSWEPEQAELLIKKIGEFGCQWAAIRDLREPMFMGRSNVQLKDKARNLKFEFLKAKVPLPHNFDMVTISRKQLEALQDMGIDPYYVGGLDPED